METAELSSEPDNIVLATPGGAAAVSNTTVVPATASGGGKGKKNLFYQRSDSTLCLGFTPPDLFDRPLSEAWPLADQPHMLQPSSRKEDLFGFPKFNMSNQGTRYDVLFIIIF